MQTTHELSERSFIGALLHLPASRVVELVALVRADDLTDPRLRLIYGLAGHLAVSGTNPDAPSVHAHARTTGTVKGTDLPTLVGLLVDLYGEVPIPAAAESYARAVIEAAVRRRISEAAERLTVAANESNLSATVTLVERETTAMNEAVARLATAPLAVIA